MQITLGFTSLLSLGNTQLSAEIHACRLPSAPAPPPADDLTIGVGGFDQQGRNGVGGMGKWPGGSLRKSQGLDKLNFACVDNE